MGEKFGFDFQRNWNEKVGVLRKFNKNMKLNPPAEKIETL